MPGGYDSSSRNGPSAVEPTEDPGVNAAATAADGAVVDPAAGPAADSTVEPAADPCSLILAYLTDVNSRNPRAEVSSQELCHEIGLAEDVVRDCIEYLVGEGSATADLFPRNIWVQLADPGRENAPPPGW
jgi:hypothetical protein